MKLFSCLFPIITMAVSLSAEAALVQVNAQPAAWRVENYPGDGLVIWYTGAPCGQGQLIFDSTFSKADLNRFWVA
jgi:hypothetical protein